MEATKATTFNNSLPSERVGRRSKIYVFFCVRYRKNLMIQEILIMPGWRQKLLIIMTKMER